MKLWQASPIPSLLSKEIQEYYKVMPKRKQHLEEAQYSDFYTLRKQQLLRMKESIKNSLTITCESGCLWITERDSEDIILHPGDRYHTKAANLLVMEGLEDSTLRISEAC